MGFLERHQAFYRQRGPFSFTLVVTLESLLISLLVGGILNVLVGIPERGLFYLPPVTLFLALVVLAPLLETFLFQVLPVVAGRKLGLSIRIQILLSMVFFAAAHFLVSWQVGLAAGVVAGTYLAFTFAFWLEHRGLGTAYLTTFSSHALRNLFGFLLIMLLLPAASRERIQYDTFTHPQLGTVWHFYDRDDSFLFAIVDEHLLERVPLSQSPNALFDAGFDLELPAHHIEVEYLVEDSLLTFDGKAHSTTSSNCFFLHHTSEVTRIEAIDLDLKLTPGANDKTEIPTQIERELWRRQAQTDE